MDMISIATGAAGIGGTYGIYRLLAKAVPAVVAWIKAKWNYGKSITARLQADISDAHTKIAALEQGAIADLQHRLANVEMIVKPPAASPAAAPNPAS